MSPYVAGALLAVLVASHVGTAYVAHQAGVDSEKATQAREDEAAKKAFDAGQQGAAAAIAKLKPRNVTIRQETEREIQTNTIYAQCRHSPEQLQRLNEALAGRAVGAGGGELPGAGAAQ